MFRTLLTLTALALTACEGEVICTTEARASVNVTVVTIDGDVISNATGTFSSAAGDSGECESIGDGLACGWEVEGVITVTITADGFETVEQTVTVEKDACHVIAESIEVELRLRDDGDPI
jgi:hypothetical protein